MDRPALLDDYLAQLLDRRRLSRHTHAGYARDLDRLFALVPGSAGKPLAPERIAPHHVRAALARLHAAGLAPRSIARALSAWRGFFGWLGRHHGLAADPCAGLRAPKSKKALPKALSPDAAAQLLARTPEDDLESRDRAMFELLYSSGLRLAELHGLDERVGRAAVADAEITVLGKGGKQRAVPVGAKAREALADWLRLRATVARPGEPALFVSARGTRLAMRTVQLRLERWAVRAGLGAKLHPHVLRHSFASHVLQSSGDLRAVQEMLGHSSISSTQIYTSLDWQHLARVYDAAHPRAKKKT